MSKCKALLLDVDGVLVKHHKLFSHDYAEKHGYRPEDFDEFFAKNAEDAWLGKTTYRDLVVQHNDVWRWDRDPDELLEQWFSFGVEENIDRELVAIAKELRAQGVKIYLATNQDRGRGEWLKKKFSSILDGAFLSSDLGFIKEEPEFFQEVLKQLQAKVPDIKSSEILFFDDVQENINAAKSQGIAAFLYQDANQASKILD